MLDEFQNLGRLGPVERDISLAGGFGVQFWLAHRVDYLHHSAFRDQFDPNPQYEQVAT